MSAPFSCERGGHAAVAASVRATRSRVDADEDYFLNKYKGTKDGTIKYSELGQQGQLNPMIFDFLAVVDTARNGELSAEEIEEASDMIGIAKKGKAGNPAEASLNYKHLPKTFQEALAPWDTDKSGSVSASELKKAAEDQQKMSDENRLVKKLLMGAIIVILLLSASTFVLSLQAAEMAKETRAEPDGVLVTDSGKVAAMGTAMQHFDLVDMPRLPLETLKEIRDFSYQLDDTYFHRMISGFDWHSETKMLLIATNGDEVLIDNGVMTLVAVGPQCTESSTLEIAMLCLLPPRVINNEANRRLNFAGALLTSGSFTMMASSNW